MNRRERALGCMLGLAIGDALGAPVEFDTRRALMKRYGPKGVTRLHPWGGHAVGSYTDDTQMSFATAYGLVVPRFEEFDTDDPV